MLRMLQTRQKGFTLIEMVMVIAIIGILSSIAWSYYSKESIRNRRTEAVSNISIIANDLDEYHSDKKTYVGYTVSTNISNKLRWYTITVSNLSATTYTVTLTPTGAQTDDADCKTITIDQSGKKGYTGDAPSAIRCWGTTN